MNPYRDYDQGVAVLAGFHQENMAALNSKRLGEPLDFRGEHGFTTAYRESAICISPPLPA